MPQKTSTPRQFVTLDDAAAELDCSVRHLRRLIAVGKLPAYTLGSNRVLRIDRDDLNAALTPVIPSGLDPRATSDHLTESEPMKQ